MKTVPTKITPASFITKLGDAKRRADANALVKIFARATGEPATMWGTSIIGFGSYHYRYASGREGDMCIAGFSPRASAFAIYVLSNAKTETALLGKLGKHDRGKGCLYIKQLADVDAKILEQLVRTSSAHTRATQECGICVEAKPQRAKRAK
ncbi:MAG TPA: DUF1801 domain-containing protein [Kofleriaceae bacterium]